MAYSDFTLKSVKTEFNLQILENLSLFSTIQPIEISDYLQETLQRNVPLALAINTEKARSELIIINILLEVKEQLSNQMSLFSGINFNVDPAQKLIGFCDYIMSGSSEQLYLESPVITIVEAKNENIIAGMGQCIAEMYAAKLYNEQNHLTLPSIYGAVTTGDQWKFLKLTEQIVYIDLDLYYLNEINQIIAILVKMIHNLA